VAVFRRLAENRNLPLRILYPLKFQFLFYVWGQKYSDMKKATILCLFTLLLALTASLKAQIPDPFPTLPLAPNRSPVFGKDVVIYDNPGYDETATAVCSAFNGWLYAACAFDSADYGVAVFLRSTDNGITWLKLSQFKFQSLRQLKFDMFTVGMTENDLKL
jgi:hypothetical protein